MEIQEQAESAGALIIMGVAGIGKSSVGRLLADHLGWTFGEGDDFHSGANVDKMSAGHELSDSDRLPWLLAIDSWIDTQAASGRNVVVTS